MTNETILRLSVDDAFVAGRVYPTEEFNSRPHNIMDFYPVELLQAVESIVKNWMKIS